MEKLVMGARIHYALAGSGEKRVVLLHGWGCDLTLMQRVADALSPDMTVLSVDFPAHGGSSRPPEPWGVPEYAAALRALLAELNFAPCDVVAHSFGGRVTIYLAAEEPALFRRIVLTGAAGIRPQATEAGQKKQARYKQLKGLCEQVKRVPFLTAVAESAEDALRKKYGSRDYNALDEEMRRTFVKVVSEDLTDRLQRIQSPTLLLWGTGDTETPLWMGQKMEREIPDAALVPLEGGTHFAYLEQSARFNAIVRHFFLEE